MLAGLFGPFMTFGNQFYWLSYLLALAVVAGCYIWMRRGRAWSLKGLWGHIFPRKMLRHPSTRLDMKLYLLAIFYLSLQAAFLFSIPAVAQFFINLMTHLCGPGASTAQASLPVSIVTPILLFLALEFGYWFSHYNLHKWVWLWEFHKVHHSAEVLTPLTELRQHPVEMLLVAVSINISMGLIYALLVWFCGNPRTFAHWDILVVLFMVFSLLAHLRHTHLNIATTGWLGYIIQSPVHHQIHHSTQPRHFNKNLGFCLSVWDWAFGTLYLPQKSEKLKFGLGTTDRQMQTVAGTMTAPLIRALHRLRDKKSA